MVAKHPRLLALLLASLAATPMALAPLPAAAQAEAGSAKAAAAFIDQLADDAYGVIRAGDPDDPDTRTKLRSMLAENFAVEEIGEKLIRRHRAGISDAQYQAYAEVFPAYVVGAYTDNLFAFADSELEVIRAIPRGARGDADVYTRIVSQGAAPIEAIWSVTKKGDKYLVRNLTVSGVNLTLTQEADFNAYINRNGFDALVDLMKRRSAA